MAKTYVGLNKIETEKLFFLLDCIYRKPNLIHISYAITHDQAVLIRNHINNCDNCRQVGYLEQQAHATLAKKWINDSETMTHKENKYWKNEVERLENESEEVTQIIALVTGSKQLTKEIQETEFQIVITEQTVATLNLFLRHLKALGDIS